MSRVSRRGGSGRPGAEERRGGEERGAPAAASSCSFTQGWAGGTHREPRGRGKAGIWGTGMPRDPSHSPESTAALQSRHKPASPWRANELSQLSSRQQRRRSTPQQTHPSSRVFFFLASAKRGGREGGADGEPAEPPRCQPSGVRVTRGASAAPPASSSITEKGKAGRNQSGTKGWKSGGKQRRPLGAEPRARAGAATSTGRGVRGATPAGAPRGREGSEGAPLPLPTFPSDQNSLKAAEITGEGRRTSAGAGLLKTVPPHRL